MTDRLSATWTELCNARQHFELATDLVDRSRLELVDLQGRLDLDQVSRQELHDYQRQVRTLIAEVTEALDHQHYARTRLQKAEHAYSRARAQADYATRLAAVDAEDQARRSLFFSRLRQANS